MIVLLVLGTVALTLVALVLVFWAVTSWLQTPPTDPGYRPTHREGFIDEAMGEYDDAVRRRREKEEP